MKMGRSTGKTVAGPVPDLPRSRVVAFAFIGATAFGLLAATYRYLDYRARAIQVPPLQPLVEELTGHHCAVLIFLPILFLSRRLDLRGRGWPAWLAFHLAAIPVFSFLHTTSNWLSREAIFPLVGLGDYDYGILHIRYAMELPMDVMIYVLAFSFIALFDRYRAARHRELVSAQLEARLAHAQLQNLQAQLHPHFLFNALNTISSVMYDDVRAADRMLARLSDLLRRALHASRTQEVALAEELELLGAYLDLMRARFGERLEITFELGDDVRAARVPPLVLQPLLENALHHGAPPPPETARIAVRCHREGDRLVLEVEDNGPGLPRPDEPILGRGVGLTNTAERLRGLYGPAGELDWRDAPGGGLIVRVRLPFRESATGEEVTWTVYAS